MIVQAIEPRSLTFDHLTRWSQIQQADGALASPFFCPEFTRIVGSVRDDVYVGVLEEDGRIVGFFPFQRGRLGAGQPLAWKISDYQGLVVEPGVRWSAKGLIRDCGLKTWEFDHLITSQHSFEPFHRSRRRSPFMDLSNGLEAYLDDRRKAGIREIAGLGRKMRKLEREQGPLRFAVHTADRETLRTLLRWKSEQYLSTGAADVLARGWIRQVVELAHGTQTGAFSGVLSALYAGDQIAALHMGLRSSEIWHYWFPAYDPRLAGYSPGLILLLKMAESASSLGIRIIDLGKGEARYKLSMMSGAVPLAEGRVELPSLAAATSRLKHPARALVRRAIRVAPGRRFARRALRRG
jgi:CelD/BcsL family acetyltransferase involved in cellulose biosynthesis